MNENITKNVVIISVSLIAFFAIVVVSVSGGRKDVSDSGNFALLQEGVVYHRVDETELMKSIVALSSEVGGTRFYSTILPTESEDEYDEQGNVVVKSEEKPMVFQKEMFPEDFVIINGEIYEKRSQ